MAAALFFGDGAPDAFAQAAPPAETSGDAAESKSDGARTTVQSEREDELTLGGREQNRTGRLDVAAIPAAQKKLQARKMIEDQKGARDRASSLFGEAQGRNDMVQANCVGGKLIEIKGLLKVSQQAEGRMVGSLDGNKAEEANHAFNLIHQAHQKSGQLRAEAEQCVGELSVFTGDTQVDVEIDPSITPTDPTQPVLPPPGPETPVIASEF